MGFHEMWCCGVFIKIEHASVLVKIKQQALSVHTANLGNISF
jgi:hypothetical protein